MRPEVSAVLEIPDSPDTTPLNEVEEVSRVAEFHTYVSQNAEVMVESDRAPGYKAPFGVLMGMCAAEITEENVDMFFAEAGAMLARAAAEIEEEEIEELDSEDEIEARPEPKSEKSLDKKSDDTQSSREIDKKTHSPVIEQLKTLGTPRHEEAPASSLLPKTQSVGNKTMLSKGFVVSAAEEKPSKQMPEIKPAKAKDIVNAPAVLATTTEAAPLIVTERPVSWSSKSSEPVTLRTKPAKSEPGIEVLRMDMEYEIPNLGTESNYTYPEPEKELSGASESIEIPPPDDELLWERPEELFAFKIIEIHAGETLPSPPADHNRQSEKSDYHQMRFENTSELIAPLEEVEQTILIVAESIEAMEAEKAEAAHQIFNEIVEKVMEAQALFSVPEITPDVVETEQELTELFIRLFDCAGIEYTPGLLDSWVKLSLSGDVSILIEKAAKKNPAMTPQDKKGTHEVINYLLSAIGTTKKTAQHAYRIGKSALSLCSLQLRVAVA